MKRDANERRSPLGGPQMQAALRALVDAGKSLSEIQSVLSLEVSRQAIHKSLKALGLELHRSRGDNFPGRAVASTDAAKRRRPTRERAQPFLSMFRTELDELLVGAQHSYAEIWDELKRRHPFVPQLSAIDSAREKSLRISVWVLRERRKRKEKLQRKSQP